MRQLQLWELMKEFYRGIYLQKVFLPSVALSPINSFVDYVEMKIIPLNSCPNCKSTCVKAQIYGDDPTTDALDEWAVECYDCGIQTDFHQTGIEAVTEWNEY